MAIDEENKVQESEAPAPEKKNEADAPEADQQAESQPETQPENQQEQVSEASGDEPSTSLPENAEG